MARINPYRVLVPMDMEEFTREALHDFQYQEVEGRLFVKPKIMVLLLLPIYQARKL